MRNILLIIGGLVLTVLVSIGLFVYPTVRDAALQGTGYAAKNICSSHFVSGFPVDEVIEEALATVDPALAEFDVDVDEDARTVDVSAYGIYARRAVNLPAVGCVLLAPGDQTTDIDVSPIQFFAPPSNDPWPMGDGPANRTMTGVDYAAIDAAIADHFAEPDPRNMRYTKAVAVFWRGELIAERYADGVNQHTPLLGWSMSKSVTNTLIGILQLQEEMNIYLPAEVPEWQGEGDPRREITVDQMLRMSSGLAFDETYAIGTDVTRMLSQEPDAGAFAAAMPLAYEPGEHWAYSSGTTNILSRLIRQTVGGTTQDHYTFAQENLFLPLRANSFVLEPDASGTFIGSSYTYATARDWGRLGQLFLQDGMWDGVQMLPLGWAEYSRSATFNNPLRNYGAHFWLNRDAAPDYDGSWPTPMLPSVPRDAYAMNGFQGQVVLIVPSQDLVIVRLGFSTGFENEWMDDLASRVIGALDADAADNARFTAPE